MQGHISGEPASVSAWSIVGHEGDEPGICVLLESPQEGGTLAEVTLSWVEIEELRRLFWERRMHMGMDPKPQTLKVTVDPSPDPVECACCVPEDEDDEDDDEYQPPTPIIHASVSEYNENGCLVALNRVAMLPGDHLAVQRKDGLLMVEVRV